MDITTKESSNLLADKRALKFAAWQSKYEHLKTLLTHKTAIEHPLQMFRESLERGRERLLSFCFRRSHFSEQWPPLLQDDTPSLPFPPVDATTVAPATALAPTTGQDPVLPHQPPVLCRVVSAHCPCRHFNDTNHKPRPTSFMFGRRSTHSAQGCTQARAGSTSRTAPEASETRRACGRP